MTDTIAEMFTVRAYGIPPSPNTITTDDLDYLPETLIGPFTTLSDAHTVAVRIITEGDTITLPGGWDIGAEILAVVPSEAWVTAFTRVVEMISTTVEGLEPEQ